MANVHSEILSGHAGHHDHAHDHEEHHESFVAKYVFSMDHKMISRQFLITAVVMAVIAMTELTTTLSITKPLLNINAMITTITSPIYPLSLSKKTVAITSLAFFVYPARSAVLIKSPPIVEGRKMLKKAPPEKEMTSLFTGICIPAALKSISQRTKPKK